MILWYASIRDEIFPDNHFLTENGCSCTIDLIFYIDEVFKFPNTNKFARTIIPSLKQTKFY